MVEGIDSVTLTCAASANPEAELAWRKEGGGRVLGNFPTLDIGVVSRTDMGTYTCTATNPLGVSAPEAVDVVTYCEYWSSFCALWSMVMSFYEAEHRNNCFLLTNLTQSSPTQRHGGHILSRASGGGHRLGDPDLHS